MLRHAWYGLSSGLIAGLIIGLIEAVFILAGINTGEYAALLFAALFYSLTGGLAGVAVGFALALLHRLFKVSDPFSWTLGFSASFVGLLWVILRQIIQSVVYHGRPIGSNAEVILFLGCLGAALFLLWFGTILMQRTPLKILLRVRGTGAFYLTILLLAAVFSLAPVRPMTDFDKHQPPDLEEHPNVLLIVVDGLRTDRIGAYEGRPGLTPVMDRLASEGILFEQAFTSSPAARPALATLMTSSPPSVHEMDWDRSELPESAETLAEVLSSRTYLTAGFPNSRTVARSQNFQQGFDQFDYRPPALFLGETESIQRLVMFRLFRDRYLRSGWPQSVVAHYRPAKDIFFSAREAIEAAGDQRWFVWAHLMDVHPPYFARPLNGQAELLPGTVPAPQHRPRIMSLYDSEVSWVDSRIGDMLQWLESTGQMRNTVIILTASHGTELQDHGGWGFGHSLYDEVLRVPIIIRLPNGGFAGARAGWQVRLMDISPTIAKLVGGRQPESWLGRNLLGPSFTAWADGEAPPPRDRVVTARTSHHGVDMSSIRTEGWKFIRMSAPAPHQQREELYQIIQDPLERQTLAGQEGAMQARMSSMLRNIQSVPQGHTGAQ